MSVTATLHSRGDTVEEANDRSGRIIIHIPEASGRVTLLYNAFAQAEDVRRYSGVDFLVIVPVNANVDLTTSNGAIQVTIPRNLAILINADTSNGLITSSLSLVGDTKGKSWSASLNPPITSTLTLKTSNGVISIDGLP